MDYTKITSAEFEGIDRNDYPDFVDSFCVYAEIDGTPLTQDELNELNDSDEKYEILMETMN
jgi:hypothetical protein